MWMPARRLVSANRLDLFARTEFVKSRILDRDDHWSRNLYRNFLVDGSTVSGSEQEVGRKAVPKDYFDGFNELIDSMAKQGFDSSKGSILLGDDGVVDGAHRLAVALHLDLPVHVVRSSESAGRYDYHSLIRNGLSSIAIDAMAFNLIKVMSNCRATLLFSLDQTIALRIEKMLAESSEIVIRKRINLSEIGKRRIVELAYGHNEWWSTRLLERMTAERFPNYQNSWCDVIFTLEKKVSELQQRKSELRRLLPDDCFERRIHGSDEYLDTFYLAESLLNRNSLHFLNTSRIGSESRIFEMIGGPIPTESPVVATQDWAIDGSAVLEIHGIRLARDIDFIATCNATVPEKISKRWYSHNDQYAGKDFSIDDVVIDPRRHLVYRGVKFISLETYFLLKRDSNSVGWREDLAVALEKPGTTQSIYQDMYEENVSHLIRWLSMVGSLLDKQLRRTPRRFERLVRRIAAELRKRIQ